MKRSEFLKSLGVAIAATVVLRSPIVKALSTPNTPCTLGFREFTFDGITVYWKPLPMFDAISKYPLTEREAFQKLDMSDYEEA